MITGLSHVFPIDCLGGACIASVTEHITLALEDIKLRMWPAHGQHTAMQLVCVYN